MQAENSKHVFVGVERWVDEQLDVRGNRLVLSQLQPIKKLDRGLIV